MFQSIVAVRVRPVPVGCYVGCQRKRMTYYFMKLSKRHVILSLVIYLCFLLPVQWFLVDIFSAEYCVVSCTYFFHLHQCCEIKLYIYIYIYWLRRQTNHHLFRPITKHAAATPRTYTPTVMTDWTLVMCWRCQCRTKRQWMHSAYGNCRWRVLSRQTYNG